MEQQIFINVMCSGIYVIQLSRHILGVLIGFEFRPCSYVRYLYSMQLMKWQDLIWYAFLNLIWYVMKEKLSKMLVGDMVCYFQKTFKKKKCLFN